MAKDFTKGIDNVFSPTTAETIKKTVETARDEKTTAGTNGTTAEKCNGVVSYNIRYSRDLQKRIKRFCIEHDGVDMKDVFTQGAIMYMDSN